MRDAERTRAKIVQAAFDVVHRRGFRSSSVSEIVARAGVTEGAFFHYFPTKNDLGYALADETLREITLNRWTRPLAAYRNPVQGMVTRFRKNMEATTDEELVLGCPVNNLTQEMSSVDPVFRDKLQAILNEWISETERYLRKAQAEGYLRRDVDTREAAEFIVMAEEGSAAIVKNLGSRQVYSSLYNSFRRHLESLCVKGGAFDARQAQPH